jgi:hypothetical protein
MKFDKGTKTSLSVYSIYGAIFAVIMAGVGWLGIDIWLASTQWLLVSLVLGAFAIYLKLG